MGDDDDWTDGRELPFHIFIPRVIGRKHPATSLLSLTDYEQLQFESFTQQLQRKTNKMTGKQQQKRAAYWETKNPTLVKIVTSTHCGQPVSMMR